MAYLCLHTWTTCQSAGLCGVRRKSELYYLFDGHRLNIVLLSPLSGKRGRHTFLWMWEGGLKYRLQFSLYRETGLHFGGCQSSDGRYILSRTICSLQQVQNFGTRRTQEETETLRVRDCRAMHFIRGDELELDKWMPLFKRWRTWPLTKIKLKAPPAAALWSICGMIDLGIK